MYGTAQSNPGNVLDRNSLSEMNLKVLKRIDPFTEEVSFFSSLNFLKTWWSAYVDGSKEEVQSLI